MKTQSSHGSSMQNVRASRVSAAGEAANEIAASFVDALECILRDERRARRAGVGALASS